MKKIMQAGYGKVNITPDFPVGLAGYGGDDARRTTHVVMPVYITCVAVTEGDSTVLLYTVDTCGFRLRHARAFRDAICRATGVPVENIFFGATHCHNGPTMSPDSDPSVAKTVKLMMDAAVEAAKIALADRASAEILAAKPEIKGMNFTRHYRLVNGKRTTSNTGMRKDDPIAGHMGPSDSHMVLVKFAREEKKDILLVNWQAHPDNAKEIGFTSIAPGWIGPMRDTLEADSGALVAYFTGASGNQAMKSRIPQLTHGLSWREYGEKLAHLAAAALPELKQVEGTGIRTARTMLDVEVNHTEDHKLEQAKEVAAVMAAEGREAALALCRRYGFTTPRHAAGVRMRAGMEKTDQLELNAFRIGGIGFANNTCETFSDQGLFIKNYSPYEYTLVITGNRSYLAAAPAYDYQSYEAVGGSGYYVRGTAEKMADRMVHLLEEVK